MFADVVSLTMPLSPELADIIREQSELRSALARIEARIGKLHVGEAMALQPKVAALPPPLPQKRLPEPVVAVPFAPPTPSAPADSLEMVFGTVWLARIGVVVLLTGLVFLGNYAYQLIVPLLGAGGKLALLYMAGCILAGLGVWLERSRESMRGYARVLLAGGAATIYYATYAAHFVEPLRVIASPIVGGLFLLALAAGLLWLAERRQAQLTALLTISLAYYTSALNPVGQFTLFSALLLGGAALWLQMRQGWTAVTGVAMLGTYGSFAFWRWPQVVFGSGGSKPLEETLPFLGLYWILFAAAAWFAPAGSRVASARTAFVTLNNALFFGLATAEVLLRDHRDFWVLALVFGAVQLGIAAAAAHRRPEDATLDGTFLSTGLALVLTAALAKLTGTALALSLAVFSFILLAAAGRRHAGVFRIAGSVAALLAWETALEGVFRKHQNYAWTGLAVAGGLVANAWWVKRRVAEGVVRGFLETAFAILAFLLVAAVMRENIARDWLLACYAAAGVACIALGALVASTSAVYSGIGFAALALGSVISNDTRLYLVQNLAAILAVPAALRAARRHRPALIHPVLQTRVSAVATVALVAWVTTWVWERHGTEALTVAWSLLAVVIFATGLGLQERVYRLAGFALLAMTVGRVFLVDVWRLETLYRIVSFLVLGIVLLALGYVYNRWADRIRRWL